MHKHLYSNYWLSAYRTYLHIQTQSYLPFRCDVTVIQLLQNVCYIGLFLCRNIHLYIKIYYKRCILQSI